MTGMGRFVEYETGVRQDGYVETFNEYICWLCTEPAGTDGYCAEHYEERLLDYGEEGNADPEGEEDEEALES